MKLLLFRSLALTAVPLLLLLVLECGLRLFGYGYPSRLFLLDEETGSYTLNERFMWRFVPRAIVDSPLPVTFSADKSDGTCRIFVLGESAVQGTPDPAFSFSRFLEVILSSRYPESRFEVVNTGVAAINSHVVRHIAREIIRHEPDLTIVYMGNNEVVGPYGPGTVFSDSLRSLTAIRASIWIRSTKVGQLIGRAIEAVSGGPSLKEWHGMAAFTEKSVALSDPRMATVYHRFRRNLEDISAITHDGGGGLVICTVGTNLKDFPPLASSHSEGLAESQLKQWTSRYRQARSLEQRERHREAAEAYGAAAEIDPEFAELWYRLGRCLESSGDLASAHESFVRARDLDTLRFRADSTINAIISGIHSESSATTLVDTAEVFRASPGSKSDTPGSEFFWEHVHMNPSGNYLLAEALAGEIHELVIEIIGNGRAIEGIPTFEESREMLALTDWDLYLSTHVIAEMTRRPPFVRQMGHDEKLRRDQAVLDTFRARFSESAFQEMAAVYETAVSRRPDDLFIRRNFARLELIRGNFDNAIEQLRVILSAMPGFAETHVSLGSAYLGLGKKEQAAASFARSLDLTSNPIQTLKAIGDAYGYTSDWSTALSKYRQGLEIEPAHSQLSSSAGEALARLGLHSEATAAFRSAVSLRPNDALMRLGFGLSLMREGKKDAAIRQLQAAIRLNPHETEARAHLGWVLLERGELPAAEEQFLATLATAPGHAGALRGMGLLSERLERTSDALRFLEMALQERPDWEVVNQDLDRVRRGAEQIGTRNGKILSTELGK